MADPVVDPQPADNPNDWKTGLPDDIRGDPSLEAIKDLPALAKSYIHAQRLVGMDKIPLPAKDATPEAWNEFYSKLGKPEAPDKYELPEVKYPEWYPKDEKLTEEFRGKAHELHLLPGQVKGLFEWFSVKQVGMLEAAKELADQDADKHHDTVLQEIKQEWGKDADTRLKRVQALVGLVGGKDLAEYLAMNQGGRRLGDHPGLIRFLDKLAADYPEHKLVMGDVGGAGLGGKAAALREIARINADTKHPAWNDGPGHKEAVAEMTRLSAIAYAK